jgi:acetyltransferase-like isoleucine patch superfamily enzyme
MKNKTLKFMQWGLPVPRMIRPVIRLMYGIGVILAEGFPGLKKIIWIEPVMRSVCERVGRGFRAERLPYMRGKGRLILGDDVHLSGRSCFYFMRMTGDQPVIAIGNHVFIGNGCTLSAARRITIGDHCLISAGVRIHDNDGHPLDAVRRVAGEMIGPDEARPVTIEEGAWIGAEAAILKGVTIGRNAVVGTGAVVTHDVPANSVAAGNPAQLVRTIQE